MQKDSNILQTPTVSTKKWLLMIGVILIAANLRAPLTSIGSLITSIRTDLDMSHAVAGTITTLPFLHLLYCHHLHRKSHTKSRWKKPFFFLYSC